MCSNFLIFRANTHFQEIRLNGLQGYRDRLGRECVASREDDAVGFVQMMLISEVRSVCRPLKKSDLVPSALVEERRHLNLGFSQITPNGKQHSFF